MNDQLRKDIIELMEALQSLAYGVMLQTGTETATKLISAAEKVKIELERSAEHNTASTEK